MKPVPKEGNATTAEQGSPELEQQIRCRAYQLYEQRGGTDGHDMDDWLQAESEIVRSKQQAVAA